MESSRSFADRISRTLSDNILTTLVVAVEKHVGRVQRDLGLVLGQIFYLIVIIKRMRVFEPSKRLDDQELRGC